MSRRITVAGGRLSPWSAVGAFRGDGPLARCGTAVVLALLVALFAVANALAEPAGLRFHAGVVAVWTSVTLLFLGAALLLYLRWRMSRESEVGWLAATALWAGLYVLSFTLRLYVNPDAGSEVTYNTFAVLVAVVALALFWNLRAGRPLPAQSPTLLGLCCLGVSAALQLILYLRGPLLPDKRAVDLVTALVIGLVALLCVAILASTRQIDRAVRRQLSAVCVLCATSCLAAPAAPLMAGEPSVRAVVAPLLALLAGGLLLREALFLLGRAHQVAAAEAIIRERRDNREAEELHELRASLSGVAKAIQLLAGYDAAFTDERRQRLTKVLAAEIGRMERLLARSSSASQAELLVDEILEPVVFARRMDGQCIEWERSGCHVVGMADGIVEAVNILLVNAANHAPSSHVRISAHQEVDRVRLRIADDGPGVPRQVRRRLFTQGVRGRDSNGQGIGLDLAHRLVRAQGGAIELVDPAPQGGAVFDLVLPAPQDRVRPGGRRP